MTLASTNEIRLSPSLSSYARNSDALSDISIRLTTGNRIVRGGDDAANLSTAAGFQSQTAALRSSLINGTRASGFLQVASDGLGQIRSVLDSLETLTNTANSSGVTPRQFAALDAQLQSQLAQIDAVVTATTFEGNPLLDGSISGSAAPAVIVDEVGNNPVSLAIPDLRTSALFASTPSLMDSANAALAVTPVSDAAQAVDEAIALVDAYQKRLGMANDATMRRIYGLNLARDDLTATDVPKEEQIRDFIRLQQQTAASIMAQTLGLNSGLLDLLNSPSSPATRGKIPTATPPNNSSTPVSSVLGVN
jgi:flagellin